jgi:hypothetical protein
MIPDGAERAQSPARAVAAGRIELAERLPAPPEATATMLAAAYAPMMD